MDVDPPGAGPVLDNSQLARLSRTMFTEVVQFAETTSTNSVLIEQAAGGAPAGLVAVADYQRAGRGRFDRRWESPPGKSLLFSVLLRPSEQELPTPDRHLAVAAVSLALVDGAAAAAGAQVQIKWPNDLVVGDLKLAGVLAESVPDALVVGAGVNVDWSPEGLAVTYLNAIGGRPVERGELLVETLLALDRLYGHWDLVSRRYRATCATVGREVTVNLADTAPPLRGLAVAIDDHGRLVVRATDGSQVTVAAGDVTHVRPTGAPSLSAQ
jgi:BirA family transcriptional regulator, biotin operon repressor / biotin---[acetyl-CoA-carboxylase] ligase